MSSNKILVEIQICSNCKEHQWCTRHKEGTYLALATQIANQLHTKDNHIQVKIHPVSGMKMGSFQIICQGNILFSKLSLGYFPHVNAVTTRILNFIDDYQKGNDLSKYQPGLSSPIKSHPSFNFSKNQNMNRSNSPHKRQPATIKYKPQYQQNHSSIQQHSIIKKQQHVNQKKQKQVHREQVIIPKNKNGQIKQHNKKQQHHQQQKNQDHHQQKHHKQLHHNQPHHQNKHQQHHATNQKRHQTKKQQDHHQAPKQHHQPPKQHHQPHKQQPKEPAKHQPQPKQAHHQPEVKEKIKDKQEVHVELKGDEKKDDQNQYENQEFNEETKREQGQKKQENIHVNQ